MIQKRKAEHVKICLEREVQCSYNYWNDVHLIHHALPEIDMRDIDTSVELFGKRLSAPIIISAMTGGYDGAEKINRNLAIACEKIGIGLGVGSQRPALENKTYENSYSVVREYEVPLRIANIGAPQLVEQERRRALSLEDARGAMEMIDADVLAVHLNFLQEVTQPEGDVNAKGCLTSISKIADRIPTIAKETGAGVSRSIAEQLSDTGIIGIDVGGKSGTSFSAVEYYRAKDESGKRIGKTFWDWGIPTPVSVIECKGKIPIIATGGVRTGLDVAKALVLGSNTAGIAFPMLRHAVKSSESVVREIDIIIQELKCAMFLQGAMSVDELRDMKAIITGETAEWLSSLNALKGR